jgi:uncharacterized membrane protein YfhO
VISLTTTAPRKSFLVISNSFYPGWRAYLDGRPVKIYPTDYLYHGLLVPAGKHHVQLHFHPRSVQIGRIISSVSVFILALLLISYVFYYAFK